LSNFVRYAHKRAAMLVKEQNDYLTQTGPGTPWASFFRSYWIPALLACELAGPIVRRCEIQALVGKADRVPRHPRPARTHRRILRPSPRFAVVRRNEENGLRCPYHGWKFDVTGQCVDIPSELPAAPIASASA